MTNKKEKTLVIPMLKDLKAEYSKMTDLVPVYLLNGEPNPNDLRNVEVTFEEGSRLEKFVNDYLDALKNDLKYLGFVCEENGEPDTYISMVMNEMLVENFESIVTSYDNDLVLKEYPEIRIIDYRFSNSIEGTDELYELTSSYEDQ